MLAPGAQGGIIAVQAPALVEAEIRFAPATWAGLPMSQSGQTRSFGFVGSMSGLPETGHERHRRGGAA